MNKTIKRSILASYLIGLPIGFLFTASIIILPSLLTGEGLLSFIMLTIYGKAIIGLLISFTIVLWFGGVLAQKSLKKGKSLLLTSLKYSALVNFVIWTVFSVVASFNKENEFGYFQIPLIAFVICTVFTTLIIPIMN